MSNFYYMNFASFTFPAELKFQYFGHMIIRLPRTLKISNEDTRSMYCPKFSPLMPGGNKKVTHTYTSLSMCDPFFTTRH